MRILVTTPHPVWPADSGPAVRTLSIAGELAGLGHEVTVLTSGEAPLRRPAGPVRLEWYPGHGSLGHFTNRDFRRAYRGALAARPALVVASYPYQSLMLVGPAARAGVPLVYDAQNVEADRFRRLGRRWRARVVRGTESLFCARARAVLAVTPDDRALLERYYGCRSILLPNGVDVRRFCPAEPDPALVSRYGLEERHVVLFFGSLGYPPNLDALRFLHEAWPAIRARRPDACLLIVGRDPPGWAGQAPGVVVAGPVDDIVAHIRLAHVVAVPLRAGGGMRLKIVEALACGQSVLSTPFGAAGLLPADDGGLLLAEREGFVDRLLALLEQPPVRGANAAARRLAMRFDWSRLVAGVDWEGLARARSSG